MKLTNTMRDAFVRSVMDDVPEIDFAEQMQKAMTADAVAQLPDKVRALYGAKDTTDYVCSFWYANKGCNVTLPGVRHAFVPKAATLKVVEKLAALQKTQRDSRNELRNKVRAVAYSASTKKSLADLLPEFAKYLPADEVAACKTLPVVAGVVSSFVKAGWPKDGKKKQAAKVAA